MRSFSVSFFFFFFLFYSPLEDFDLREDTFAPARECAALPTDEAFELCTRMRELPAHDDDDDDGGGFEFLIIEFWGHGAAPARTHTECDYDFLHFKVVCRVAAKGIKAFFFVIDFGSGQVTMYLVYEFLLFAVVYENKVFWQFIYILMEKWGEKYLFFHVISQ